MSHEPFIHDAAAFLPVSMPGGVEISDVEAKYAALFAEVIWDGLITPEKRQQLRTAAEIFGLASERARQIEDGLLVAHRERHRIAVVEQNDDDTTVRVDARDRDARGKSIAPLAPADDQRVAMLQARVAALESQSKELQSRDEELRHENERLEQLVERLRHALTATTEDLEAANARAAGGDVPTTAKGVQALARDDAAPAGARGFRSRRSISVPPPPPAEAAPAVVLNERRDEPTELHRQLRERPRDADILRVLFRSLQRSDDADRRWCIAHALVYLGKANDQERAMYSAHADAGLVRPTRAVNEDEWYELLFHPDEDHLTGEILAEIAPAVLLGHMTAMRASLAPELIDPALQVDPKQSHEQAVRCLSWAAAALGTKLPPVYVCRDLDITADIVLNPKPTTRLGIRILSGRSTRELAFFAGQHLCWYRKEHLLGKPSASVRRLEDMFVAALSLGNAGLPMTPEIKQRVEPIAATIRPLLGDAGVARLQRYFQRFVEQGGRTNLVRWLQSVERTAACTGLLLANDLAAAEAALRADGAPEIESMMDELIVFFTAARCSTLRRRIGIAIG
jgi:hypothetical protein